VLRAGHPPKVNLRRERALRKVTQLETRAFRLVLTPSGFRKRSGFFGQRSREGDPCMRKVISGLAAALVLAVLPVASDAGVFVSVSIAPPVLPVYALPAVPGPGYVWTPGYWAWGPAGYYWVPGTWVLAPVGMLWTPGYWGWAGGAYVWHAGYWGPHVGFYGGVNYGFGYSGVGFRGGYWNGGVYVVNRTVINEVSVNRVAFNGGAGGIVARPSPAEIAASHEQHIAFTSMQRQHEQMAAANPALRASVNGGRPQIAATARPGEFSGHGAVAAREASFHGMGGYPEGHPGAGPHAGGHGYQPAGHGAPGSAGHRG
jgi:hypothetical protein